jgi:membrane fusion protein YbhG
MHKAWAVALSAMALPSCGPSAPEYSGTLQAPSAAVGSTIGGRIAHVYTVEGAFVHKNATLVRFDDAQQRAAVAAAAGRLSEARAILADLQAGARPQDLARAKALAARDHAQLALARSATPYQATVTRNQLRQALANERDAAVAAEAHADAQESSSKAAVRAASAQTENTIAVTLPQSVASARAAYEAANEQYLLLAAGARPDQIRQGRAGVRAALGQLADAQAKLAEMTVRAPAEGVVTAMDLHAGDLLAPGASVATIEERGNPYVRIYVSQQDLGRLKLGDRVTVRADSTPGTFQGIVEQIDARAQFTPESVQTKSDRAVLSYGVKVRVHDPTGLLHPGTTVEVPLP